MDQYFPHEKLDVYTKALGFVQLVTQLIEAWPPAVSVRDQLDRASESIVTNMVRAVRLRRTNEGRYCLECSVGSVLESAACLDVARVKRLLDEPRLHTGKRQLQEIARMAIGLRRSWESPAVEEESSSYVAAEGTAWFPHESLAVYQRALQLYEEIEKVLPCGESRTHRYVRRIDEAMTSVVLNIAEGNGRFSRLDHGRFTDIAEEAGTKLAAYLDLTRMSCGSEVHRAKSLLREVMAMLAGLKGYLESGSDGKR